jgi:hypothetical protein
MTTAQTDAPTDVRRFLIDGDTAAVLTEAVRSGEAGVRVRGGLGAMPAAVQNAVLARAGAAASDVLALDMVDILGAAWRKHAALRQAAAETLAAPDSEQVVHMIAHKVSFKHAPSVEIRYQDQPIATILIEAVLDMEIKGLLAVVRSGYLTGVQGGTCDVVGTLSLSGTPIARRQRTLELRFAIGFRQGIPLLRGPDLPEPRRHS